MAGEPRPRFGHSHGLPVHLHVSDYHAVTGKYDRANRKIALWITGHVGTMSCFWVFSVFALFSLPATLHLAGIHASWLFAAIPAFFLTFGWIYLISWVCQNYIQLVLLPALMVGQNLQNEASDARSAKQFEDLEQVKDWLDLTTSGGLEQVLAAVSGLRDDIQRHYPGSRDEA